MIKQKILMMMGVGAMLLSSCNNDESVIGGGDDALQAVALTGSVSSATRAVDVSWDTGDQIGLTGTGMMANKAYVTAEGDGTFTAVGATDYYMDAAVHNFTAYYPYSADVSEENKITFAAIPEATVEAQKANDFLWAEGTGSAKNPNISMTFKHKMARVIMNVTTNTDNGFYADDVFGTADGSSITSSQGVLCSVYQNGSFDITTGAANWSGGREDLTMTASQDDAEGHVRQYVMILPAQACGSYKHVFNAGETDEQAFSCKLGEGSWDSGYTYTYNIVIGRGGVKVVSATIENWNQGQGSNEDCQPA